MACTTKSCDNLAMVAGPGLTHAPDGYYLLRALGDADMKRELMAQRSK
jgi:hypothetical protein